MSISMTHTLQSKNMSTWADVYNTLIDTCDKNIKKLNNFIQQECIKLINSGSKDIYNVTKDSISNKFCSFKLSIHRQILKN